MARLKNLFVKISSWFKSLIGLSEKPQLQIEWDENEKLHQKLKQLWDSEYRQTGCKPMNLQLSKRAQSGNVYYEPKNLAEITVERMYALDTLQTQFQYNFDSPENFSYLKSTMDTAVLSNSIDAVRNAWHEFTQRAATLPTNLLICQWCAMLMIRHDENPYVLDTQIFTEKVMELQKDDTLRAFFLARCTVVLLPICPVILAKLKLFALDCAADLVAYSQKMKIQERMEKVQKSL